MGSRHVRIVSLWLRDGDVAGFESFERQASRLMAGHGGRIERAVRVTQGDNHAAPFEVHVVSFPDAEAFEAYRADPAVIALKPARERVILRTQTLIGHEVGPW